MENLEETKNKENLIIEEIKPEKKKKILTEEHKAKLRDSMAKALAVRKQNILARKELKEAEMKQHEEKKEQLQKRYEKTKNNKKTKELHEIAYNILSKNQESDSDSEGIIEEIVIKKAPKVSKPKLNRNRSVKILPKEDDELIQEIPKQQEFNITFY